MFSILIPTWNNLEMLKLCVESIHLHSHFQNQIIVHINEGSDGTREWADTEGLTYTASAENIGVCKAVNLAFGKATMDYIIYLNDDMFVLPDWDKYLADEIQKIGNQLFMLSSTMIEPEQRGDLTMLINENYGRDVAHFQREKLMREYAHFEKGDWYGASWPPLVVSRQAWLEVGGFSVEFSPGMYSDPDLSMKLWQIGCRIFKGVSQSRVYHFQARSTGRVKKNDGRLQFMKKWGIPSSTFYQHYLKMGQAYAGPLPEVTEGLFFPKLKARLYSLFK